MKPIDTQEAKQLMTELLRSFHDFCETHELRYYIAYGTLIGAVRHGGFIPWDDDIDVVMPRPDYEKFIELTRNGMGKDRLVESMKTKKDYIYPFAKLIDPRTRIIEEFYNADTGIYIDIFPIDGLPQNEADIKAHYQKMDKLRKLHSLAYQEELSWDNPIKHALLKTVAFVMRRFGRKFILNRIDQFAQTYDFDHSDMMGLQVWGYGSRAATSKTEGLPVTMMKFETLSVKAPANYDAWLTQVYGDYMTPPPENKRASTHGTQRFWLE